MLARIKNLWIYLSCFFLAKKIWSHPSQSEVLIFDSCNQDILMQFLNPWKPAVLHVRGEEINMKVLLKSLFRSGNREDAYVDCFIEKTRPRLVVTFMDNHSGLHSIAARNPNITTLFLQNGMRNSKIFERLESRISSGDSLKVNYMMTFGDYVGTEYAKYIEGCAIPMGSVLNNHVPRLKKQQTGVIAFISQWDLCDPWKSYFEQASGLILQCLVSYAKENGKKLTIIPRNRKQDNLFRQEKDFYRGLMGSEPEFYESKDFCSGYQAVDSAEVVVTLNSTLGFESIARGNKTAHFSMRPENLGYALHDDVNPLLHGLLGEGLFWTDKTDFDSFIRILGYLFEVDDLQWKKDVEATNFSSLMFYDPGNKRFKSILEKELGPLPETKNIVTPMQRESV